VLPVTALRCDTLTNPYEKLADLLHDQSLMRGGSKYSRALVLQTYLNDGLYNIQHTLQMDACSVCLTKERRLTITLIIFCSFFDHVLQRMPCNVPNVQFCFLYKVIAQWPKTLNKASYIPQGI
jgi:hypothetical protein